MNLLLGVLVLGMHAWGGTPTVPPIERIGDSYVARQPQHGIEARFGSESSSFLHRQKQFGMTLQDHPGSGSPVLLRDGRLELPHGEVTEWFVNTSGGLEHGFTIARKLSNATLRLTIAVTGDYAPILQDNVVHLRAADGSRLTYGGLKSWDATGRTLASHAEVHGSYIHLFVDDADAQYPVTVDPLFQETAITASDPTPTTRFAHSIAASGETVVIGAPYANNFNGAVYVYVRSNGSWVQQARLTPVTSGTGALAGAAVVISGDTLAIGIPGNLNASLPRVAIYTRSGSTWTPETIPGTAGVPELGASLALDGNTLVVGSPREKAMTIYIRSGGVWSQQARFTATPDQFGRAVAVDGDTAVVGALHFARLYVRSGTVWSQQAELPTPAPVAGGDNFGVQVAVSGDTVFVSDTYHNARRGGVHLYSRSNGAWPLQTTITASEGDANTYFGHSIAVRGDLVLIGTATNSFGSYTNLLAYIATSGNGAAYLYARTGPTSWAETKLNPAVPVSLDSYGFSVALAGNSAFVGAPTGNADTGHAIPFRFENIQLNTTPAGRSFTLTGTGCNGQGTFTTPYSGFWTSCSVQWTTPQESADTRTTFLGWGDGNPANPRGFTLPPSPVASTLSPTTVFRTEYKLTTTPLPESGGTIVGSDWYLSGTQVLVQAIANSGFSFAGFGGAASGIANPLLISMTGPKTVTASFAPTPPAILSGFISMKTGNSSYPRAWVFTLTNNGPGIAYDAQVYFLMFVQTFGTPCTALPIRRLPASLPFQLGTIPPGTSTTFPFILDFSGCPANARFTATLGYTSNNGASGGVVQLANQTR
jgi:hypothetical protein